MTMLRSNNKNKQYRLLQENVTIDSIDSNSNNNNNDVASNTTGTIISTSPFVPSDSSIYNNTVNVTKIVSSNGHSMSSNLQHPLHVPSALPFNNSHYEIMNVTMNISSINTISMSNIPTAAPLTIIMATASPTLSEQQDGKSFFQRSFVETLTMPIDINWIIVGCMLGILGILLIAFTILVTPLVYNYFKFKQSISPQRIKKRYETIEGWMISKRVIDCQCYYHTNNKNTTGSKKQSTTTLANSNPLDIMNQYCIPCDDTTTTKVEGIDDNTTLTAKNNEQQQQQSMRITVSPSKLFRSKTTTTSTTNYISPRIESVSSCDSNDTDVTISNSSTNDNNPCIQRMNCNTNTNNDSIEYQYNNTSNDNEGINESCTNTSKQNDNDDNDNECPICMEPFVIGEIVSWSPNNECHHAFHHQCIKEWLIHHDSCPYCRTHYLLVDRQPPTSSLSTTTTTTTTTTTGAVRVVVVNDDTSNSNTDNIIQNNNNDVSTNNTQTTTAPTASAQIPQEVSTTTWRRQHRWGTRQGRGGTGGGNTNIHNNNNNNNNKESSGGVIWTSDQLQELAKKRATRSNCTYFCVQHGLIQIQHPKSISRSIRKQLLTTGISNIETELPKYRNVTLTNTNTTKSRRYRLNNRNNNNNDNDPSDDSDVGQQRQPRQYPILSLFQYYRYLQNRHHQRRRGATSHSSNNMNMIRLVMLSLRQRLYRPPNWSNNDDVHSDDYHTTTNVSNNTSNATTTTGSSSSIAYIDREFQIPPDDYQTSNNVATTSVQEDVIGSIDIENCGTTATTTTATGSYPNIESNNINSIVDCIVEGKTIVQSNRSLSSDLDTATTAAAAKSSILCNNHSINDNDKVNDDTNNMMSSIHSDCTFSFQEHDENSNSNLQLLHFSDSVNINQQSSSLSASSFGLNTTSSETFVIASPSNSF